MSRPPSAKPNVYRKANVLLEVDRIQTPLLILHGEEDPQVPPQESVEFTQALKKAGTQKQQDLYIPVTRDGIEPPLAFQALSSLLCRRSLVLYPL